MGVYKFKRKPECLSQFGIKNSTWHEWINRGLMIPGVALGPRAVGYPEHALNAIAAARLAGKSEGDIRALVRDLIAARGNDTYLFATGAGVDVINDYDTTAGNTDVVQFADVASTGVTALERQGEHLVVKYGTSDQLTLNYFFYSSYPGRGGHDYSYAVNVGWLGRPIFPYLWASIRIPYSANALLC